MRFFSVILIGTLSTLLLACGGGCYEKFIKATFSKNELVTPYGVIKNFRPSGLYVPKSYYEDFLDKPFERPGLSISERKIMRIEPLLTLRKSILNVTIVISSPREDLDIKVDNSSTAILFNKDTVVPISSLNLSKKQHLSNDKTTYYSNILKYSVAYEDVLNLRQKNGDTLEGEFPFSIDDELYFYSFSSTYEKGKRKVDCFRIPSTP